MGMKAQGVLQHKGSKGRNKDHQLNRVLFYQLLYKAFHQITCNIVPQQNKGSWSWATSNIGKTNQVHSTKMPNCFMFWKVRSQLTCTLGKCTYLANPYKCTSGNLT